MTVFHADRHIQAWAHDSPLTRVLHLLCLLPYFVFRLAVVIYCQRCILEVVELRTVFEMLVVTQFFSGHLLLCLVIMLWKLDDPHDPWLTRVPENDVQRRKQTRQAAIEVLLGSFLFGSGVPFGVASLICVFLRNWIVRAVSIAEFALIFIALTAGCVLQL